MKPILCLDFDGVIHSYTSGWTEPLWIVDPPVEGAFDFIWKALEVFDVQVYSSRSSYEGGIDAMKAWFTVHGQKDLTYIVRWPLTKPAAFVTIDDRAITFDGVWPSLQTLKEFKPWNKKTTS